MFGDNGNMTMEITEEVIARQPPEAQAIIRLLLAEIARLESRIEELQRQVKGKTPQNSSLPPSTQHPHARPISTKPKSHRKRGGQPGHAKHQRQLVRPELGTNWTTALSVGMAQWCRVAGPVPQRGNGHGR